MTTRRLIQMTAAALAAASALQPSAARAAEPMLQISSSAAEGRIVITAAAAVPEAGLAGVLSEGGMVSRIRLELSDAASATSAAWTLELAGTLGGVAVRIGRFDAGNVELVLPKPLGLRFERGDSIVIRMLGAGAPTAWRLVAEYEPLDGPVSRIAVLPVTMRAGAAAASTDVQSWHFAAPAAGRLLAVTGLILAGGAELSLVDEQSGAALWRETVHAGNDEAFGCAEGVVRAGVMIGAERSYRITVAGANAAAASLAGYVLPAAERSLALRP
jgi:hypothetical protein